MNDWASAPVPTGGHDARSPNGVRTPGLKLNTSRIDIPKEDMSLMAKLTRSIASCTGMCFTPVRMLGLLRVLKAVTFLCLVFTIAADLMYIFFVELFVSSNVNTKVGGARDAIIRTYGLGFAAVALAIELDYAAIYTYFSALKGFIPRSFLLFFIATITSAHPLHSNRKDYSLNDDDTVYDQAVSSEIPSSTVAFQMVTSFLL